MTYLRDRAREFALDYLASDADGFASFQRELTTLLEAVAAEARAEGYASGVRDCVDECERRGCRVCERMAAYIPPAPGADPAGERCGECGGRGDVHHEHPLKPGVSMCVTQCRACDGTGKAK